MFAGMTFTIFDAVANINNNINSNNNNNNNQNINFQQSINTVVTGNINVANQINVMNALGRRRRRRMAERVPRLAVHYNVSAGLSGVGPGTAGGGPCGQARSGGDGNPGKPAPLPLRAVKGFLAHSWDIHSLCA
jgi:hypothetical protein